MKRIKLSKGMETIVDDEMFDYLNQWKWHLSCKGYAVRSIKKPYRHAVFMHRLINKTSEGFQTDHINHNKLDNRKCNLRTVTNTQNHHNMPLQKNNTSGFAGISWCKERNKWVVQFWLGNKPHYLGRFSNKEEAIKVRNLAEKKYYEI